MSQGEPKTPTDAAWMATVGRRSRRRIDVPDLVIKIVGLFLTLATIWVSVRNFDDEQRQRVELEFRGKLWLEKLNACRSLGDLVGQVTAAAGSDGFQAAVVKFRADYWGPMILVEDQAVQRAMVDFNLTIDDFQSRRKNENQLKAPAVLLLKECRCSVESVPVIPGEALLTQGERCAAQR